MTRDLTQGSIPKGLLWFVLPLICGNLFQQLYNLTDTWIVGRFIGEGALGAVGSSYTLLTFLSSILLGLCMGSAAYFSIQFGRGDMARLRQGIFQAFVLIGGLTLVLNVAVYLLLGGFLWLLRIPAEVAGLTRTYLLWIFGGIAATFLYNYFASLLRALGNSVVPLIFLAVSTVLNIALDLWFVLGLKRGVTGAAEATVIAQYVSGIGIAVYTWFRCPQFRTGPRAISWSCVREIASFSILTCVQQSVMNLGILMVQGLVNSFGATVMAAFAAAVKIDAFAYMPVQDFGNAFSTFIAQNYGAQEEARIRAGLKGAVGASMLFCVAVSALVCCFAHPLMAMFVGEGEAEIILEGIRYLRIEGAFYCGIGCLFLLYGLYRALGKPGMSVILTVISLGTRVALAYILSAIPTIGVIGIWWSVPIGWALADIVGILYYILRKGQILTWKNQTSI